MIRLIDYGKEVGINIGNEFKWYPKVDVTVSSDEDAKVSLFNKGELIVSANTEEYNVPYELSVKDLVFLIKKILTLPDEAEVVIEDEITLEDIYKQQLITNSSLELILVSSNRAVNVSNNLLEETMLTNKYLRKIYNPK